MVKLARFLKDFKKQVFLGPLFKLIEAIFELIIPIIMAKVIDVGVKNGDEGYVLKMGGILVLLYVVGLCSTLVCQRFAAQASQGVGTKIRDQLYAHIMRFSHAEIDKFGSQTLVTRLTADVNQIQLAVAMLIRLVVRAPFLVIGSIIVSMFIDLSLSSVFLVMAPVVAFVTWLIMSRSVPYYKTLQKKLDKVSLLTGETLSGARVIRAFSKQKSESEKAYAATDDYRKTAMRVERLATLLNPLTFMLLNFATIAVIWFGGYRVDSGTFTQGELVAFVNYLSQIALALMVVANLVVIFTKASASAARINEVFETAPSITDGPGAPGETKSGAPVLCFEHVFHSYGGEDSLSDISFTVLPGQTIGIIGGTGSGKSTLINLIPRFYDVSAGKVLVGGVDVREYKLEKLRQKVSIVPQHTVLFNGTVESNLRLRDENASLEDLEQALAVSQSKEFVDALPGRLSAPISEGGKNLSGGQKQRLTIARALVAQPEILILDDATSALDYSTDAKLRQALAAKQGLQALILVSQRAASIRHADQIFVLDDGKIVGSGTHQSLLASCPIYHEICKSQSILEEEVK